MSGLRELVLTMSCSNQIGIVRAVSGFLADRGCNIGESQQFDESIDERFHLRIQATYPAEVELDGLVAAFGSIGDAFGMTWSITDARDRTATIIMVSKADHCLRELIERWRDGLIAIDIVAVVSNHRDLEPVALQAGLPFVHL